MSLEIKLNDRTASVDQISVDGSKYMIRVDDKTYEVDAIEVERGVYSFLYNGEII
jgi:hypothetical protein